MLACTLPAARFSLEFARSLEKGLDLLGQIQPDVVIVGRDSAAREVCQRVRSLPAGPELHADPDGRAVSQRGHRRGGGRGRRRRHLPAVPLRALAVRAAAGAAPARRRCRTPARSPRRPAPPAPRRRRGEHAGARPPRAPRRAWDELPRRASSRSTPGSTAVDYYELLDLRRQAGPAEIKDAYFKCSMELHPDRFMQLDDEELQRKDLRGLQADVRGVQGADQLRDPQRLRRRARRRATAQPTCATSTADGRSPASTTPPPMPSRPPASATCTSPTWPRPRATCARRACT